MKHWTAEHVLRDPCSPDIVRAAAEALAAYVGAIGSREYPRLVSISHSDGENDVYQYEVVIELASGLILPAECGLMESVTEGWDEPESVDDIVQWTVEGVEACMPIAGHLSNQLHQVRMRARRLIAGWLTKGVQSRLVEARLAPYDSWRGSTEPGLVLLVEGCDEQLRTSDIEVQVERASALEKALDEFEQELSIRLEARARLATLGATGEIDQLALNAIAHFGNVAETLRRFENESRFWLPDATALVMHNGVVTAGNGGTNPAVYFGRGRITFAGFQLPETTLVAATGQPITVIAQHPFLSSDMSVLEASSWIEDDTPMITFKLDMPQWLFCSATGRTWRRDDGEAPAAEQDNVIELSARSN